VRSESKNYSPYPPTVLFLSAMMPISKNGFAFMHRDDFLLYSYPQRCQSPNAFSLTDVTQVRHILAYVKAATKFPCMLPVFEN